MRFISELSGILSFLLVGPFLTYEIKFRMASYGMLRRVVLTRATRRNILGDAILHSHLRENLKSYKIKFSLGL
jgi:hypothetical protein